MPTEDELLAHASFLTQVVGRLIADSHAVNDVVQETLLVACRTPPRNQSNLRGWLKTVAVRLVYRRTRGEKLRVETEQRAVRLDAQTTAHENEAAKESVTSAVLALDEPYRTVIVLHFFREESAFEISKRLKRPLNTVNSQIQRGLERLRLALDREYGGRSSWCVALLALDLWGRGPSAAREFTREVRWGQLVGVAALVIAIPVILQYAKPVEVALEPNSKVEVAQVDERETVEPSFARRESLAKQAESFVQPTESPGLVRIHITDEAGKPLPDSAVYIFESDDSAGLGLGGLWRYRMSTDDSGIAEVEVGTLTAVKVAAAGDEVKRVSFQLLSEDHVASDLIHVVPPESGSSLDLRVTLASSDLKVHGRVTDSEGAPIGGARVSIGRLDSDARRENGHLVTSAPVTRLTDAEGRFEAPFLAPGRHAVHVAARGFSATSTWIEGAGGEVIDPVFELERAASLLGRVTLLDGTPLANARVWVEPRPQDVQFGLQPTTADVSGAFRLEGVPDGVQIVWAQDPDDSSLIARAQFQFVTGANVEWNPTVIAVDGLSLRFVSEAGEPLAGLALRFESGDSRLVWVRLAETDEQGRAAIFDYPDVPISVDVFEKTASLYDASLAIQLFSELRASPAEQQFVIRNEERIAVSGFLVDHSGSPLTAARLYVSDLNRSHARPISVDATTGAFVIPELMPRTYQLVVWRSAHGTWPLEDLVISNENVDLGTLRAPKLVPLAMRWDWPAGTAWELIKLDWPGGVQRAWPVDSGTGPPKDEYLLFPGEYGFQVASRTQLFERRCVQLAPNAEASMESGPRPRASVRLAVGGLVAGPVEASLIIRELSGVQSERKLVLTGAAEQGILLDLDLGGYELELTSGARVLGSTRLEIATAAEVISARMSAP